MRKHIDANKLHLAHLRASAQAHRYGLYMLKARESGDRKAAARMRKTLEFWMRRIGRLVAKLDAARLIS